MRENNYKPQIPDVMEAIFWTINHPLQVTTQWVLRKKYQGSWDLMRISVRKCILPELYMT